MQPSFARKPAAVVEPTAGGTRVPEGHPPVPEGMDPTSAPCPFLQSMPGEKQRQQAGWKPANGGEVPGILILAVGLDITAVGLVIPLLSVYAKMLGGGLCARGPLRCDSRARACPAASPPPRPRRAASLYLPAST